MGAKHQKVTISIPKDLTDEQRLQLADDVIEHIRRRTDKGVDKNGSRFPRYSKSYTESLDFKVAGKSAGRVDLQLSGDMMASLTLLDHKPGKLTIGFEKGTEENARADGNIRGTYGSDSPNPRKARDFLGIEPEALEKILEHYK